MERREVLTIVGTGSIGLFAGCLSSADSEPSESNNANTTTETTTEEPQNPWGKDTVVVGYEQEVNARHGFADLIHEGLSYWEKNSEMYTGHTIEYQLRPNEDDPDILIRLVEEIFSCGEVDHDGETAGCAPLITQRAQDTTEIEIVDGYDDEPTVETIIHELGHTLGLGHNDEPQEIMSNDIADRIPQYNAKMEIIDLYRDGISIGNEGTEHWNSGVGYWDDEEYGSAIPQFKDAVQKYEEAQDYFDEAVVTTEQIGVTEAREICEEAVDRMSLEVEAARFMKQAAEEADQRNYNKAKEYWEDANEAHEKQSEVSVKEGEKLVEALGLPTKKY